MRVVVDGDTVAYKACYSTQYQTYRPQEEEIVFRYHKDVSEWLSLNFDEEDYPNVDKVEVVEPLNFTFHIVDKIIEGIKNDTQSDDITIYLSGPSSSNFRYMVPYPRQYKGNRPPKPIHLEDVRNYLCDKYMACVSIHYEADDAVGIFATNNPGCIIGSVDKDFQQIAGLHYHLSDKTITEITEVDALRSFYRQMLMGDRVDNIEGIRGIGQKTAEKYINNLYQESDMDRVVRQEYQKHFKDKWHQMYSSNFDLLKILRSEEELKEVQKKYGETQ